MGTSFYSSTRSHGQDAISFDFKNTAGVTLSSTELAGAPGARTSFWNAWNADTPGNPRLFAGAALDSTGAVVGALTAQLAPGAILGAGDRGLSDKNNDRKMFTTVIDHNIGTHSVVTVTGIPYATYDLYAYSFDDGAFRGGSFSVDGGVTTYYIRGGAGNPLSDGTGYVQAGETTYQPAASSTVASPQTSGNYVRIQGLSGNLIFRFRAEDYAAGTGAFRLKMPGFQIVATSAVPPVTTPPAAPDALTASGAASGVTLGWSPAHSAKSYQLLRAETPGGPYNLVASPLASAVSYTDTAIAPSTRYYYILKAVNDLGESPASAEVNALTGVQEPQGILAVEGDGGASLTWNPVPGATKYSIYTSPTAEGAGGAYTLLTEVTTEAFNPTGLTNGQPYYYRLTTTTPSGTSLPSAEILVVPRKPSAVRTIGINFLGAGSTPLRPVDFAGAPGARYAFWNNLTVPILPDAVATEAQLSVPGVLTDNTYAVLSNLTLSLTRNGIGGAGQDAGNFNNDARLLQTFFDQYNTAGSLLTFSGVPYDRYDVYVYLREDGAARGGSITDQNTGAIYYIRGGLARPDANGGGWVEAVDGTPGTGLDVVQGNYVRIVNQSGATGSSLRLNAINTGDSTQRLKIAGVQIVNNAPPTIPYPAPVTAVTATGGNRRITLTWTPTAGNLSWSIKRADFPGGPLTPIARGLTSPTYTDFTATNARAYYYIITAAGVSGGTDSAEIEGITPDIFSPFEEWATSRGLTVGSNAGALDDPDSDGTGNLLEFIFGKEPLTADASALPQVETTPTTIHFTFPRQDASVGEVALVFQWSADLTNWTDIPIPAATSGNVNITTNESNPDTVQITLPASVAPLGRVYGRLRANIP